MFALPFVFDKLGAVKASQITSEIIAQTYKFVNKAFFNNYIIRKALTPVIFFKKLLM